MTYRHSRLSDRKKSPEIFEMLSRALTTFCQVGHKEVYLQNQTKKIGRWKFAQHAKQKQAITKLRACYDLGIQDLVKAGSISSEDSRKWTLINERMLALQSDPKPLLWYSRRRLSREYAASPDGLGKVPKEQSE